jgi:hypothetical protein
MKKYFCLFLFSIALSKTHAQNNNSNSILIRHDTTVLKAEECEWIIKSLVKNAPALASQTGKTVPQVILEAIEKGKITAIDPETNKAIPGKEIFKWKMPVDSVQQHDMEGNFSKMLVVQPVRNTDNISQIRIFSDWYFDILTGKVQSIIKWIQLMEEVHTSTGIFLGYAALCRIYY